MRVNLTCFHGQVIVEPLHRSRRHIAIVDSNPPPPSEGKVVAVGPLKINHDGFMVPAEVFKGAWVVFRAFAGKDIEFEGRKLKLLKQSELEAVFTG